MLSFGRLISYITPHYYPKYEIWTIDKKIVNNPFKWEIEQLVEDCLCAQGPLRIIHNV